MSAPGRRYLAARLGAGQRHAAAVAVQRHARGLRQRRAFVAAKVAAVAVQSAYRGWVQRSAFQRTRGAAVAVQSRARCAAARRAFTAMRAAVVLLQVGPRQYMFVNRCSPLHPLHFRHEPRCFSLVISY